MHDDATKRIKRIFYHMKDRCYNKNDSRYADWGGRGIAICEEWLENIDDFVQWAISSGYEIGLTIDRIDNDGNYCPENCRWVTIKENNQNRRSSRYFTINGETKNLQQWCDFYSIRRSTVDVRLKLGWDIEKALTVPKRERNTTDIIGETFGYLTVVKFDSISKNRQSIYECKCICGKTRFVSDYKLKSGHTQSCGCMKYKIRMANMDKKQT